MNLFARYGAACIGTLVCLAIWLGLSPFYVYAFALFQAPTAPASANHDGPAELPRVYVKSSLRDTPAPGKTILVHAGEDPSQALEQASCGDIVELQAGATFDRLVLPPKKCDDSHWIIVRTTTPDSKLPPEGTRMTPCYAGISSLPGRPAFQCASTENVLAKIEFQRKTGNGPVRIEPGANHYRLIGLEVTRADSPGTVYNLIGPHDGAADHLIFDRMWIHGTAQSETTRAVMLSHLTYVAVVDSYLNDFHCVSRTGQCVDSQAVAGGNGDDPMGPWKIEDNFLEASGECIIFGGARATTTPADIEIRHNHFFKPMTWMKGQPGYVGGSDGSPFIVKNFFEMKNGERVLFEGNVLENNWGGYTQWGYSILLGPKNQGAGPLSVCPICAVTDITIRYVTVSHTAGGFVFGNGVNSNGAAAKDGGRYSIHDVVIDDIEADRYWGRGTFAQISTVPGATAAIPLHDVTINHVTAFSPRVLFNIGGPRDNPRMNRLTITNNILNGTDSPVTSTGGGPLRNCASGPGTRFLDFVLHSCFDSFIFDHNVLIDGAGGWPKNNQTAKNPGDLGFIDYANGNGGNYRLSAQSKFKHSSADGKDPGADIDAIEQATKGVR